MLMSMREKMARALAALQYGNADAVPDEGHFAEADAALDVLENPLPEFIDAIAGYFMIPRKNLPSVWADIVRAAKES